jgi:hypothetical protein
MKLTKEQFVKILTHSCALVSEEGFLTYNQPLSDEIESEGLISLYDITNREHNYFKADGAVLDGTVLELEDQDDNFIRCGIVGFVNGNQLLDSGTA